jgi:hypothetical protein
MYDVFDFFEYNKYSLFCVGFPFASNWELEFSPNENIWNISLKFSKMHFQQTPCV